VVDDDRGDGEKAKDAELLAEVGVRGGVLGFRLRPPVEERVS